MIKKIYIKLIDGTETWVPINAKLVNRGQYRIIDNDKFLDLSTDELYEFLPGDIVEIEDHVFHDGNKW
jgi:ABC-type nitrate/sulfonate/bicarbonate transport system substrate-binding protein